MKKFMALGVWCALMAGLAGVLPAWAADDGDSVCEAPNCFTIRIFKEKLTVEPETSIPGRFILYWEVFVTVVRESGGECPTTPVKLFGACALTPLGRWSLAAASRFSEQSLKVGRNVSYQKIPLASIDLRDSKYEDGAKPMFSSLFDKGQTVNVELQVRHLASGTSARCLQKRAYDLKPLTYGMVAAASEGNLAEVREALDKGADVNAKTWENWTALMAACSSGSTELVKLLVDKGADVNMRNKGFPVSTSSLGSRQPSGGTALMVAALKGEPEMVRILLKAGAKLDLLQTDRWTAVTAAAYTGNPEVMQLLLDAGADPNVVEESGYSPLALAFINGNSAAVRALKANQGIVRVPWDTFD